MKKRVAAIDFGTNTARLLIADRYVNQRNGEIKFEPISLYREIVRMGGGFTHEVGLSDDAMLRGILCLKKFAIVLAEHKIDLCRCVATSAVRDGKNGSFFKQKVLEETGIKLETIDGVEEGVLTLKGVMSGLDTLPQRLLIFDVGGGSTEYILADDGDVRFIKSTPLGVVRLTEGKVTIDAMQDKIDHELKKLVSEMVEEKVDFTNVTLVGTAGTATTLAAISMKMKDYDYRKVNNSILEKNEIERIYNLLLPLTPNERLYIPGLEKGREDLIIAGCLLVLKTMNTFGCDKLKVSDYGLLEGVVVTAFSEPA